MKKALTLLIAMYLYLLLPFAAVFLVSGQDDTLTNLPLALLVVCLLLVFIIGIFNIKSAVQLYKEGNYNKLRSEMEKLKLGSIPFFLAEFAILVAITMGFSLLAVFFFWTVAGPFVFMIMIALAAIVLYAIMLLSSVYGIAFVSLLRKEKVINVGYLIVYILLQLIPLADMIITIVLVANYRKRTCEPVEL